MDERTNYGLRGKVGTNTKLGDLQLGDEVVLVVRAVVTRRTDHYDDSGAIVCDAQLSTAGAALIGGKASWRKSALTALDQAAALDGKLL